MSKEDQIPVNFLRMPHKGILLFDGAMGTMLMERLRVAPPLELLNFTAPESVLSIHCDYIHAGARIIRTNTFGANRANLSLFGLEHQVQQINARAITLARKAIMSVGRVGNTLVAGSIGPIDCRASRSPSEVDSIATYAEQARILVSAGVDMLICETFQRHSDIESVINALLSVAKGGDRIVPFALCLSPDNILEQAAESAMAVYQSLVRNRGVDYFGFNCGNGPDAMVSLVEKIHPVIDLPMLAIPSAGIPVIEGDRVHYPYDTKDFSASLLPAVQSRLVAGIGGCCGTTPDHITKLAASLHELDLD